MPNWTEEVFIIDKIQYTKPITYKIKDLNDKEIQGSFYEPELLKGKKDVFRIDKVMRRDYKKKLQQVAKIVDTLCLHDTLVASPISPTLRPPSPPYQCC